MTSVRLVRKQSHVAPHSFRSLTGSRRVDPALGGASRPKIRILAAMHIAQAHDLVIHFRGAEVLN